MSEETVTLYRPTGPQELELVRSGGFRRWPPRLPDQPIFYPVTNEAYARQIARDWNVPQSGAGYVTRFQERLKIKGAHDDSARPQTPGAVRRVHPQGRGSPAMGRWGDVG